MLSDERKNRATGSCKPPASCAERKFFVLEGELQEVVSMNGSQESRALSIARWSVSLNPSKLCHPRCQKELIADKLAALILSSLTGPKDLECCFLKKIFVSVYFWLHWVFIAARAFSSLQWAGATLRCAAWASHCEGFSCCGAQALGTRASGTAAGRLGSCGSQTPELVLSSGDTQV